nr:laccase domain-containing protein [Candidatus Competibacter phosphatis]
MNELLPGYLLVPEWPAPATVRAVSTTRRGGDGLPPYDGFNLAGHVGDDPVRVAGNRRQLAAVLGLSTEPAW